MQIIKVASPSDSLLFGKANKYHYVDSFQGSIIDTNNTITPLAVLKAFFQTSPKWVSALLSLRNRIVKVLGLKTSQNSKNKEELIANLKGVPNEQIGLFKIFESSPNEIVMGEDDKHLNFRVSLFLDSFSSHHELKNIIITTTVQFNNIFGKLYFLPVKPFHHQIVPSILKGIIKELKSNSTQLS
ncbi:MAG: hypothetical protein CMP76_12470 [Flavobacterium sp.]|uniref:DUF2867 domain-containing protein n=1 Tax=Flavobacterium sp. TaxID=239 RepID=UPI000C5CF0AA|nr:DUF2867 domain-containing protein [Flavobacterium sp.]MBF04101.1 hypothetical protein [Flavobacterium sp.]